MANIRLENITKKFKDTTALDNVNLEIKDKEFFIVFGPAGAGKTTLMNIISGIYIPEQGKVIMDGKNINNLEPEDRNVAMVFEDYALYPHLSVYDNIASPLRSPKYRKPENIIKEEVTRVAKMMKIDWLLDRNPAQLSNGQRQRVGLGRALVRSPHVYLMDEPLTHLDAKLRHQMRAELKDMQRNLDTTTIYVTHDYLEALSLGDRIAVINEGKVVQVGTPEEIYYHPINEFVAESFGEPEINIFEAQFKKDASGHFKLNLFNDENYQYQLSKETEVIIKQKNVGSLRVGIRPRDIKCSFVQVDNKHVLSQVYSFEPLGAKAILTVEVNKHLIRLLVQSSLELKIGQEVYIDFEISNAIYFDQDKKNLFTNTVKNEKGGLVWQG